MKKSIGVYIVVFALCIGMISGCTASGKTEAPAVSEQPAVTAPPTEEVVIVPEEEPEPQQAEDSALEEQPSVDDTESEPIVSELPLTDTPATFTLFTSSAPGFMTPYIGTDGSYNTAESTRYFSELTGVTIEYIEVASFTDNFNLMIASGDYPDLLTGVSFYSGGFTKALDDEIIIDLTDLVENHMPAYEQTINDRGLRGDVMNDDGQFLSIYSVNSETYVDQGPVVRQDWLDELGMDAPQTYDDWYEMGMAFKTNYDLDYAIYISEHINPGISFSAGLDLPCYDASASATHFYQIDGQVQSALVSDNFKEFLHIMQKWYMAGIISRDFFSSSLQDVKDAFAGDACGACWDRADYITENNTNADLMAKGFRSGAAPVLLREPGQTIHYNLATDSQVQEGVSISTCCKDPELLAKTLDFCFTDQGAVLCNYGIEDKSFVYNADGQPEWTEAMTNTEGVTFRAAIVSYVMSGLPTRVDVKKYWAQTFDADSLYAVELWSGCSTDCAYDMPDALYFTNDDSTRFAVTITDVETYANEYVMSCVTGETDIDATWNDYVQKLWSLGLQDCIDMEQSAYDRYLSR